MSAKIANRMIDVLYRRTYIQAMRRWPNVRVNIFFGADFQELLENILIGQ